MPAASTEPHGMVMYSIIYSRLTIDFSTCTTPFLPYRRCNTPAAGTNSIAVLFTVKSRTRPNARGACRSGKSLHAELQPSLPRPTSTPGQRRQRGEGGGAYGADGGILGICYPYYYTPITWKFKINSLASTSTSPRLSLRRFRRGGPKTKGWNYITMPLRRRLPHGVHS